MSQLYIKPDTGERLTLKRSLPDNLLDTTWETINKLSPIVQPLAVDLILSYKMPDTSYLIFDSRPSFPEWHIQQTQNTRDLNIQTRCVQKPEIETTPKLTSDKLYRWLQQALTQDSTPSTYQIAISTLEVFYTRVRLYSLSETENHINLLDGKREVRVPIVKNSEGMWIYGPVENQLIYPPIFFRLGSHDGWLWLRIFITWEGLWTNPGLAENEKLKEVINWLTGDGWIPSNIPAQFD